MLPDVREEIELRTEGWRKKSSPELVEIDQIAYDDLQKCKEKIEKKEKTKIMNVQAPVTGETNPESLGVTVCTVQVTPQGVPMAAPPYPPSGVVYISNYVASQNRKGNWKPNEGHQRNPRFQSRYQQIIPARARLPDVQPWVPPTCFKCGMGDHLARNCRQR